MDEEPRTLGGVIGAGVIFILLVTVTACIDGFVLTTLWSWFAVPTFGLPALTLAQAIGLSALLSFITYQPAAQKDLKVFYIFFGRPALYLAFGWVISWFM